MNIQYEGKVSKDEFLKALLLQSKQYLLYKRIVGIVLALFTFSIIYLKIQNPLEAAKILQYAFPAGLFPLAIITFPWWMPYITWASYNQKENIYKNNIYGTIDEIGFTINSIDVKGEFQWSAFTKYEVSNDILLLFQGKNRINIFTKNLFSNQDDWDQLISCLKEKMPSNKNRT